MNRSPGKSTALVQRFEVRKTKRNEDFASLTLALGSDANFATMEAKIWQFDKVRATGRPLPSQGTIIEARYQTDEYQGNPQWTIQEYRILEGEERERELRNFTPAKRVDEKFYVDKFNQLLAEAGMERVSGRIAHKIFELPGVRAAFLEAPAAISNHQNYPGGLLEHTINVTMVALALAEVYSEGGGLNFNRERLPVDRKLIVSAGLIHDIGKIESYRMAPIAEATDLNYFEGHLSAGYAWIREAAAPLLAEPPYAGAREEIDKLLNCILSHHGSLEFGSPVTPGCVEAFLLAQADLVDARMATLVTEGNQFLRQNPGGRWLRNRNFGNAIFVGDWPAPPKL